MTSSYEIIWEPARNAPSMENLLDDDQPASIAPITGSPPKAKKSSNPASSRAICMGYTRSPNHSATEGNAEKMRAGISSPPKGTTANTSRTGVNTTHGAMR